MSTLKADTIQNTSGGAVTLTKQEAAKVWFNYEHDTPSLSGSLNVSGTTDTAAGQFAVAYTNNFSAATYGGAGISSTINFQIDGGSAITTSDCDWRTRNASDTNSDAEVNIACLFGDLLTSLSCLAFSTGCCRVLFR
jgi:hypothetical protein